MIAPDAYQAVIATPIGMIGIRMTGEAVGELDFLPADAPERAPADVVTQAVVAQLQGYFHDPRALVTVALAPEGTTFQQRVWKALRAIPAGTVLTYGELAARLGTAPRAIGGACRSNPIPILVPCHRVVARQGLGGYAGEVTGDPLNVKRWLLRHEGMDEPTA